MPNGFTVIPAIIPGNLTVTGNLSVTGTATAGNLDTAGEVRVGSSPARGRLFKTAGGLFAVVGNLQNDLATRDDNAAAGFGLVLNPAGGFSQRRMVNTAGNAMDFADALAVLAQPTLFTNTGNTTENTAYTRTLRGGTLGGNSGLLFRMAGIINTVVGGGCTIRCKMGGVTVGSFAFGANIAVAYVMEVWAMQNNSQTSYRANTIVHQQGTNPSFANASGADDVTVDNPVVITMQNVNVGDNNTITGASVLVLDSYGAL